MRLILFTKTAITQLYQKWIQQISWLYTFKKEKEFTHKSFKKDMIYWGKKYHLRYFIMSVCIFYSLKTHLFYFMFLSNTVSLFRVWQYVCVKDFWYWLKGKHRFTTSHIREWGQVVQECFWINSELQFKNVFGPFADWLLTY